jgi:eukaryotic-like serine/threonine-protein kinase
MPSSFAFTTATNTVLLDGSRRGQVAFTVSNTGGRATRGRARIVPQNPAATPWLTLDGQTERDFLIAGTQQYTVKLTVPPDAPAGSYNFRLDMVGVDNPDEDFIQGPGVVFQVPEPIVEVKKPFPWWIVAVAAAVIVVAAVGAYLLWPRSVTVPLVVGHFQPAAQGTLEAVGLKLGPVVTVVPGSTAEGIVLTQQPAAGTQVPREAAVALWIAGPPATPTPLSSGSISVKNNGAFAARFTVSYSLNGQPGSQDSGGFAVGVTKDVAIPPGAAGITVDFQALTFVSWTTVQTLSYPGPVSKCFTLSGTALAAHVDEVSCFVIPVREFPTLLRERLFLNNP